MSPAFATQCPALTSLLPLPGCVRSVRVCSRTLLVPRCAMPWTDISRSFLRSGDAVAGNDILMVRARRCSHRPHFCWQCRVAFGPDNADTADICADCGPMCADLLAVAVAVVQFTVALLTLMVAGRSATSETATAHTTSAATTPESPSSRTKVSGGARGGGGRVGGRERGGWHCRLTAASLVCASTLRVQCDDAMGLWVGAFGSACRCGGLWVDAPGWAGQTRTGLAPSAATSATVWSAPLPACPRGAPRGQS